MSETRWESDQIRSAGHNIELSQDIRQESYDGYKAKLAEILQRYFVPSQAEAKLKKLITLARDFHNVHVWVRTTPELEKKFLYDESTGMLVDKSDAKSLQVVCPDGKWLLESLIEQELKFLEAAPGKMTRGTALDNYILSQRDRLELVQGQLEDIANNPNRTFFLPDALRRESLDKIKRMPHLGPQESPVKPFFVKQSGPKVVTPDEVTSGPDESKPKRDEFETNR